MLKLMVVFNPMSNTFFDMYIKLFTVCVQVLQFMIGFNEFLMKFYIFYINFHCNHSN